MNLHRYPYPPQKPYMRVCVYLQENSDPISGTIVRRDKENPLMVIFKLDNGKYITEDECFSWIAHLAPNDWQDPKVSSKKFRYEEKE